MVKTSGTIFFFESVEGDYQFVNPWEGITYDGVSEQDLYISDYPLTYCRRKCSSPETSPSYRGTAQIQRNRSTFFRATNTPPPGRITIRECALDAKITIPPDMETRRSKSARDPNSADRPER